MNVEELLTTHWCDRIIIAMTDHDYDYTTGTWHYNNKQEAIDDFGTCNVSMYGTSGQPLSLIVWI